MKSRVKFLKVLFLSALVTNGFAQDRTIRLMTYNILNYRNTTSYCTGSNNNSSNKEDALATIVQAVEPDLVVLNEIGSNPNNLTYLLNNSFNTGTTTQWSMAQHTHNGFSSLVNGIAYRNDIFGITNHWTITKDANNNNLTRLIDVVRFYYKDALLQGNSDTATFVIIAAHFKAGNTSSDESDRAKEAQAIIDWVDAHNEDNILLMGDLNTYSSNETGFQTLVAGNTFRFEDPATSIGNWHNNSSYASLHTQSTRTSGNCHSGGGLDDRFDMILCSEALTEGDERITYSPNTYIVVGNDGNHFNNAVNSGTNYSVGSATLSALYLLSDHLPVIADFDIEGQTLGFISNDQQWSLPNPMPQSYVFNNDEGATLKLYSLSGQLLWSTSQQQPVLPAVSTGMYVLIKESDRTISSARISIQ
jgi:endonuclease/exonuclease/phosphatase family metal-dependent hydrolase